VLAVLETDSPIPPEVMAVVAELLGYVYRANNESMADE
jgi:type III secretion system FlhB-like substrate exporter